MAETIFDHVSGSANNKIDALNDNLTKMTLLWSNTNSTDTPLSETEVTLSEDISHFDFYIVTYLVEYGKYPQASVMVSIGAPAALQGFAMNDASGPAGLLFYRCVQPSGGNKFFIGTGWYTNVNVTPTAYAGACVPRRVIGVKI